MFPTVAAQASASGTGTTYGPMTLPSGIVNGSLVIIVLNKNAGGDPGNPSGWTRLSSGFPGGNMVALAWYRFCDGTESAPSVSHTDNVGWRSWAARFADHHPSTVPAAAAASGNNGSPDPANLDPSWSAAEDTRWLAVEAHDGSGYTIGPPTNYTEISDLSTDRHVVVADRELAADSENPGTFSVTPNLNSAWVCFTIAIRPFVPITRVFGTIIG